MMIRCEICRKIKSFWESKQEICRNNSRVNWPTFFNCFEEKLAVCHLFARFFHSHFAFNVHYMFMQWSSWAWKQNITLSSMLMQLLLVLNTISPSLSHSLSPFLFFRPLFFFLSHYSFEYFTPALLCPTIVVETNSHTAVTLGNSLYGQLACKLVYDRPKDTS